MNLLLNALYFITILLFLGAPLLSQAELIPPFPAFIAWVGSLVPAILLLVVGGRALVGGLPLKGALALILGIIPLIVFGYGIVSTRIYPPINDITTDLANPPTFVNAAQAADNIGKDLSYPEQYKSPARAAYADLEPLHITLPPNAVWPVVESTLKANSKFHLVRVDPETFTVEGEEVSAVFHFFDDFVIRILPENEGSRIDIRSRSRVGQADFGANANRIRAIKHDLMLKMDPGAMRQ